MEMLINVCRSGVQVVGVMDRIGSSAPKIGNLCCF